MKIIIYAVLMLFFYALSVQSQSSSDWVSISEEIKYQFIGTYDKAKLNEITTTDLNDFSKIGAEYPKALYNVNLYRVQYSSVIPEFDNRPTVAYGLLAVPLGITGTMPVVSYQHGTLFSRNAVPSYPDSSMETKLEIAGFSGQGYILIAADYFGKGLSKEFDSFLVKASTQQACLDMYLASKIVCDDLKIKQGQLFLSGWSQGGWCTLVFLNKLESLGIPVTAAGVMSAPTDVFMLINRWIHNPQPIDAPYLNGEIAILVYAYEEYYKVPGLAASVLRPEYLQVSKDFYENKISYEELYNKVPSKLSDYFQADYIKTNSISEDRFSQLLQQNQSYHWRSITPLQTYFGEIDEAVCEYIATLMQGYQKIMGGAEVTAIDAGSKADHHGTFAYAIPKQKIWFDSFLVQ
jgi:hypothetical protein